MALAVTAGSSASGLEIELDLRGPEPPLRGELVVTTGGPTDGETVLPLATPVELPTPSTGSSVTCRGEGLWCPQIPIRGDEATLPVFHAVTVTGRISGPGAGAAPTTGTVQGVVASEGRGLPIELRETLTIDDASFSFTAPRTRLDLRFAFPGAAPVYRWAVTPPEEDGGAPHLRLGTLTLHPGASLSGWAHRREDELPIRGAKVDAYPVASAHGETLPLHTWTTSSDERGFFQLHGLEPGSYRLELSATGQVPQVLEAVEVAPGTETLVGVVLLDRPLRLAVHVEPPRHPDGGQWTLELSPVRRLPDEDRRRIGVDRRGNAEVGGLRPADYYVKVQTSDGEGLLFEQHHLDTDTSLTLEVPIVEVAGMVRLGGEPLAAAVELVTGAGDRVTLTSGEDGELAGWMRRPERPSVVATVRWREGDGERQRQLQVLASLDDDLVQLEIELPAGVVHGEVVDAQGRPQPRFRVIATPAEDASRSTRIRGETDEGGRFHLTGLSPERYYLQAGGNGGPTSEAVMVDLSDALPVDEVRLVVWPTREVTVQVTAEGRPVAGASVGLEALGRFPVSLSSRTDGEGNARFDLPEAVERAVVTVFAPSLLLWSGCLPIGGERLPLALPPLPGGTLTLTLTGRNDLPVILGGKVVLLTGEGGFVPHGVSLNWNRLRNAHHSREQDGARGIETVELPALAPGSYALAWSRAPDWELAARACAGAFAELDWVTLPPGGEAHLGHDSSEEQQQQLDALTAASRR